MTPIKLSQYIKRLKLIAKQLGEYDPVLWYSSDEEGNGYDMVYQLPGILMMGEDGYPEDDDVPIDMKRCVVIVN